MSFCRRLGKLAGERESGRSYRLATEAEWEYACRAGTSSATIFGESLSSTQANINGKHPYNSRAEGPHLRRTSAVGSYPPNAWGVYDMHGNVWEWCQDWYDDYDLSRAGRKDPQGPKDAPEFEARVMRGGAWMVSGHYSRSASRAYAVIDEKDSISGFRVALVRS